MTMTQDVELMIASKEVLEKHPDPSGALFDTTPMPPTGAPGFLLHEGTEVQFAALRIPYGQVGWPLLPFEAIGPMQDFLDELETADLAAAGFPAASW